MVIMISRDNEENQMRNSSLIKYISKNVELKVVKNVLNANYDMLQQKKVTLKKEYKKLDNVHYSVWAIEDKICNEIWNFSLEHNFSTFVDCYPNISETIKPHRCKYDTTTEHYIEDIDIDKKNILQDLENEIDTINNEIAIIRNNNVQQEIKNTTTCLDNLKSFSKEITDLIRLIEASENSRNICNISTNQQLNNANTTEGFVSARKLFKKSNFPSRAIYNKKLQPNLTKMIDNSKNVYNMCYNVQNIVKFGKFVMKKQSLISVKFEHKLKKLEYLFLYVNNISRNKLKSQEMFISYTLNYINIMILKLYIVSLMYFKTVEQFITTICIVALLLATLAYILNLFNTLKRIKHTYIYCCYIQDYYYIFIAKHKNREYKAFQYEFYKLILIYRIIKFCLCNIGRFYLLDKL
ncbi:uncharacterized protein LOC143182050 [Calliopsis andreniformis]|uniref:uncharacterized protein LOC143182050 n=1 Tax=Calliopsis andreniformis TaxID=337506 RepID=UPI003FCDA3A3